MATAYWITGDARQVMAGLPPASVDLLMTSPPFWDLRSYLPSDHEHKAVEMGSEASPGEFIDGLLDVTEAAARLLTPHGSLCVELGDTMAGSGGAGGDYLPGGMRDGQQQFAGSAASMRESNAAHWRQKNRNPAAVPLAKSHCLIPEMYRFALAYGFNPLTGRETERWRVRNTVTWVRSNPPVGALGDKFRPATSDLVVACKAKDRWFDLDAVRTEYDGEPPVGGSANSRQSSGDARGRGGHRQAQGPVSNPAGAPPLDWWNISPAGFAGAHYATWPPELLTRPVQAMCPRRVCTLCGAPSRRIVGDATYTRTDSDRVPARLAMSNGTRIAAGVNQHHTDAGANTSVTRGAPTTGWSTCGCPGADGLRLDGWHTGTTWRPGVVLDPFVGSGTTLAVATGHGRDAIGIDLDHRNLTLARERVGMFLVETTAAEVAAHVG